MWWFENVDCVKTNPEWLLGQWKMVPKLSQRNLCYKILGDLMIISKSAFYTVHPSLWTRVTTWWFSTFLAPAIKHKIHNIHEVLSKYHQTTHPKTVEICLQVKELDSVINSTEFDIPMFIQVHLIFILGLYAFCCYIGLKASLVFHFLNANLFIHFFLGVWHVHQRSSLLQAIVFYRHINVITPDDVAHGCPGHGPPWSTSLYLWGDICCVSHIAVQTIRLN